MSKFKLITHINKFVILNILLLFSLCFRFDNLPLWKGMSMCVCVCVCVCACLCTCVHICYVFVSFPVCMCVCIHEGVFAQEHGCGHAWAHACGCVQMCMHVFFCMHVCVFACMHSLCICAHVLTYLHTCQATMHAHVCAFFRSYATMPCGRWLDKQQNSASNSITNKIVKLFSVYKLRTEGINALLPCKYRIWGCGCVHFFGALPSFKPFIVLA